MIPIVNPSKFRLTSLVRMSHIGVCDARMASRVSVMLIGILVTLAVAGARAPAHADTLETVRARGKLVCGVSEDSPGYAVKDGKGEWSGLGADICRALAVAVLGRGDAVSFTALRRADKLPALRDGAVDVLTGDDAISASGDVAQGVHHPIVLAYDGQGFLVRRSQNISSALEMSGLRLCVAAANGDEEGALDYFAGLKIPIQIVKLERWADAVQAYDQKTCHVLSGNRARLAAARARAPGDHLMLPEIAVRHGYGPVVRQDDARWARIVRWAGYALIGAEGLGITSANAEQMQGSPVPEVRRLLAGGDALCKSLGLEPGWPRRMLRQVGNYGEIYERHLGARSPLRMERQLNNLAGKGGLHFAPSFR